MKTESTRFSATINARRLAANIVLQQTILENQNPNSYRSVAARRFSYVKLLCDYENKTSTGLRSNSKIAFHQILQDTSPTYNRIFELAEACKIKIRPSLRMMLPMLFEWNPFSRVVLYSSIFKKELEWHMCQKPTGQVLNSLKALQAFNFSTYHDLLHAIYFRLIPPPLNEKDYTDYYFFIESLVLIAEFQITMEIGELLTEILHSTNSVLKRYAHAEVQSLSKNPEKEFGRHLIAQIGFLKGWSPKKMKLLFPKMYSFKEVSVPYFKEGFVVETTSQWLANAKGKKFEKFTLPKQLKAKTLKLESFDLESLIANPAQIEKIWRWNSQLFQTGYR